MKAVKWFTGSFTAMLLLASCVTINIYFPAAAAEKAADRIIEDVWGPATAPKNTNNDPQSETSQISKPEKVAIQILMWMTSPVQAAEANINISSPAINAIQSKMKSRHGQLKAYFDSGAVGLTDNGLITVRDAKAISLKDRNTVKGLVADENKDRNALYAEIARANGHPEWQADIQSTFARRWIDNAAQGWWYNNGGNWQKK
jgi:uncharacterized protein YdbL (DUF1318 family)